MNKQIQPVAEKARRLRRSEASQYLLDKWGISRTVNTLAKLAVTGAGPQFQKDGRIPLYMEEWLDEWARDQLGPPVSSTAELKAMEAHPGQIADGPHTRPPRSPRRFPGSPP